MFENPEWKFINIFFVSKSKFVYLGELLQVNLLPKETFRKVNAFFPLFLFINRVG